MADDPQTTNPFQNLYKLGSDKFKKQLEEVAANAAGRSGGVEHEPHAAEASRGKPVEVVEEIPTNVEVEKKPELSGYIEKIEKEAELQQNVTDDYTQQVLIGPAANQNPQVKLPLTDEQIQMGLHRQVWESIRWLAEWCVRQAKMLHARVK